MVGGDARGRQGRKWGTRRASLPLQLIGPQPAGFLAGDADELVAVRLGSEGPLAIGCFDGERIPAPYRLEEVTP